MSRADDGFLDRWSRRKAEARAGDQPPLPDSDQEAETASVVPAADNRSDAEILDDLGLPDPETLRAGDDFRAFMVSAVPARIRSRALRVLWRSDPRLANLDGLVDHGEDFTDRATVVPAMRTAYAVGRGMVRHLAAAPAQDEAEPEKSLPVDSEPVEALPEQVAPLHEAADPEHRAVQPRRMRFTVQDADAEHKSAMSDRIDRVRST